MDDDTKAFLTIAGIGLAAYFGYQFWLSFQAASLPQVTPSSPSASAASASGNPSQQTAGIVRENQGDHFHYMTHGRGKR